MWRMLIEILLMIEMESFEWFIYYCCICIVNRSDDKTDTSFKCKYFILYTKCKHFIYVNVSHTIVFCVTWHYDNVVNCSILCLDLMLWCFLFSTFCGTWESLQYNQWVILNMIFSSFCVTRVKWGFLFTWLCIFCMYQTSSKFSSSKVFRSVVDSYFF